MKTIAIITARGGSKRIPKKNIRDFCGKPIIAYSIEAAKKSNLFDEIMVSTDSDEIARISERYGAKVPFMRSMKTSDDFSTTFDVIEEVINKYNENKINFDLICCIYPTAPFITAGKINEAYKMIDDSTDGVMLVTKYSHPPQRGLIVNNSFVQYSEPKNRNIRSQDLPPIYFDCGQFYFVKTNSFIKNKSLVCPNTKALIIDELEVQDIDNEIDWKIAEIKYKMWSEKK